jgi:hypothetical protein
MISEDLSALFGPVSAGPALAASYRQGTLLSFSSTDGTNTVAIGSAVLNNLPMLLTGAEVSFTAGDRVMLLVMGNTYLIVGKVATPGSAAFASASVSTASANATASGFALPTSNTTLCSTSITVPNWSNTATLSGSFTYTARNNFGSDVDIVIGITLDGNHISHDGYGHNGSYNATFLANSVVHTVTPGSTLSILGTGVCSGGFTADGGNTAFLTCLALFTKQ